MDTNSLLGAGEIAGAIGGSVADPALIPQLIPLALAGVNTISGAKGASSAKLPPYEDPAVTRFANEIDQKRRSFESGSEYSSEMNELKNQQAADQVGVLRSQGGNTGAAIAALRAVGMDTGRAYGNVVKQGTAREDAYTQMAYDILNKQSARRADIDVAKYNQNMLDARNKTAFGQQIAMNMLASLSTGNPNNPNNKGIIDLIKNLLSKTPATNYALPQGSSLTPTGVDNTGTNIMDLSDKTLTA